MYADNAAAEDVAACRAMLQLAAAAVIRGLFVQI